MKRFGISLALIALLAACGGQQTKTSAPVSSHRDGPPSQPQDYERLQVLEPNAEPRAKYGNQSPYMVNGRTYHVLASSEGYQQRGRASWYGRKFHGRRTSSGEIFDMHQISAAHRTLPLPTFVEVTNLDNGKRLVVRVNDRGPFHDERIIDLSYAAAVKLGFADKGTAAVEVRALNILQAGSGGGPNAGAPSGVTGPTWLQVGAFGEQRGALDMQRRLRDAGFDPVTVVTTRIQEREIHRVRLGPFQDEEAIQSHANRLMQLGIDAPVRVSLECQPQGLSC